MRSGRSAKKLPLRPSPFQAASGPENRCDMSPTCLGFSEPDPAQNRRRAPAAHFCRSVLGPLLLLAVLLPGSARAFEVNGRRWDTMPIPYWVNVKSAPDMGEAAFDVVKQATDVWSQVGCAEVSFERLGDTDATWAADGKSTIFWVTDTWMFGEGVAGATLWIPTAEGAPMEVDLALNAVDFEWRPGGGDAAQSGVVDPASVITHELGHWLGLAHSPEVHATMYQAMLPNAAQVSLDADDKWGLCHLYPGEGQECLHDWECDDEWACQTSDGVSVCSELRDPIGAPCSKTHLNCEDICLISFYECGTVCAFDTPDLSKGTCSPLCAEEGECPDGWTCTAMPQGVDVCLHTGQTGGEDAGPVDQDAGATGQDAGGHDAGGGDAGAVDVGAPDAGEPATDAALGDVAAPGGIEDDAVGGAPDVAGGEDPGGAAVSSSGSGCSAPGGATASLPWVLALMVVASRRSRARFTQQHPTIP